MKNCKVLKKILSYPCVSELLSRAITCSIWIKNQEARARIPFKELLTYTLRAPVYKETARYFSFLRSDEEFNFYRIKGFDEFFNYPKSLSILDLRYLFYEHFYEHGWHYYEIPQTCVEAGDTIVDCGAAEGLFAFKNQHRAGHIFLFEPLPIFVKSLKLLFKNRKNISIIEEAVSNQVETVYLKPDSVGSTCQKVPLNSACLPIKASTIDSYFFDQGIKVDYIKADVEGFEENVILGALKTIKRDRPKMALATYHQGQDHKRIIDIVLREVPEYRYFEKGIGGKNGSPVILHMWVNPTSGRIQR